MKEILFVCVHNSGRSQMAEAFFNNLSGGKAHASSAGTMPADQVNPAVAEVMREVGFEIGGNRPRPLEPEMLARADRVITMGCEVEGLCPAPSVRTEDWGLEDPKGKPIETVRRIRDQIKEKVLKLLEE